MENGESNHWYQTNTFAVYIIQIGTAISLLAFFFQHLE